MKKSILTTLLIAGLAMTATFAADSSALTAYINATMAEVAYSFEINYDSSAFGNNATADSQSLSSETSSTTGDFIVRTANAGNLSEATTFVVTVTPNEFEGTSTNATANTGIVPAVITPTTLNGDITYTAASGTDAATYARTISYGENAAEIEMDRFNFQWTGNTSITAGIYKSTIGIAITTTN